MFCLPLRSYAIDSNPISDLAMLPELNDEMAVEESAICQPYLPSHIYQIQHPGSVAATHLPQYDPQGRQVYSFPLMVQPMHYPQAYRISRPTTHCQHPTTSQNHQTTTYAPETVMPSQQPSQPMQPTTLSSHPQPNLVSSIPPEQSTPSLPSVASQPQVMPRTPQKPGLLSIPRKSASPAVNTDRIPGPIPAKTPRIVRQDDNGVPWIVFRYSRDRVETEYTIRCDVESINAEELSQDFMSANCVYPRARCKKHLYKGNRFAYESDCNSVAWALASLNPSLREKRGLIQRAVDSWRNSNRDSRLRSRRVRKADRINSRKT